MASWVAFGLALDLLGTILVVLPRTRFRALVERLPVFGGIERGRRHLFHDRGELSEGDPGFDRIVAILQRRSGERADPYKVSVKPDKTRLHVTLQDREYLESPEVTERWVEQYVDRWFLVLGLGLVAIGVLVQMRVSL